MRAAGWGRIINIASAHAHVGSAQKAAYVSAKHGIVGLTKVTALETAETNITANAICPGWVLTPLVKDQVQARATARGTTFEHEQRALLSEKQPSPEFCTPGQLGGLAAFLCSETAQNIRGASVNMDGGWTIQ